MKVYHFDTEITDGRNKGKTVQEVMVKNPSFVFQTLKKWAINGNNDNFFDDEVLAAANITKVERDHHAYQESNVVEREFDSNTKTKKLKKDSKSLDEIFDEMEAERYKDKKYDDIDYKYAKEDEALRDGFTIVKEDECDK